MRIPKRSWSQWKAQLWIVLCAIVASIRKNFSLKECGIETTLSSWRKALAPKPVKFCGQNWNLAVSDPYRLRGVSPKTVPTEQLTKKSKRQLLKLHLKLTAADRLLSNAFPSARVFVDGYLDRRYEGNGEHWNPEQQALLAIYRNQKAIQRVLEGSTPKPEAKITVSTALPWVAPKSVSPKEEQAVEAEIKAIERDVQAVVAQTNDQKRVSLADTFEKTFCTAEDKKAEPTFSNVSDGFSSAEKKSETPLTTASEVMTELRNLLNTLEVRRPKDADTAESDAALAQVEKNIRDQADNIRRSSQRPKGMKKFPKDMTKTTKRLAKASVVANAPDWLKEAATKAPVKKPRKRSKKR